MKSTLTDFFQKFKVTTEKQWEGINLNPETFGYQIQPNTRWISGHSQDEIINIFTCTGTCLEHQRNDLVDLLRLTKGLNLPQIDMKKLGSEKYSYRWKLNIDYICKDWIKELESLEKFGEMQAIRDIEQDLFTILPIYGHRYIVITKDSLNVYSIWDRDDIIVYGESLEEYLAKEFLTII